MQRFALSLLVLGLAIGPASAATNAPPKQQNPAQHKVQAPGQNINKLGDSQGWVSYSDTARSAKICYLIGKPSKSEPANAKRGDVTARVTHRPGEKRLNEVSFDAGYAFKEGSDADLVVDGKTFSLFTNKDTAWTRESKDDRALVEALARGRQAVITGTSARGTKTTDT